MQTIYRVWVPRCTEVNPGWMITPQIEKSMNTLQDSRRNKIGRLAYLVANRFRCKILLKWTDLHGVDTDIVLIGGLS